MGATDNKSLDLLLKKFNEILKNTENLNAVISNFSSVTEYFNEILIDIDEKFSITEINNLSNEAISKLNEIKSFNEYQLIERLQDIISESISEHLKVFKEEIENVIGKNQNSNQKIENQLKKINTLLNSINILLNSTNISEKGNLSDKKHGDMMVILQRIENDMKSLVQPFIPNHNEEIVKLRKMVLSLNTKLKRLEEDYEERILILENEVVQLKSEKEQILAQLDVTAHPIDISDDDLPF
ncbi:hypothetical protein B0I26_1394 [Anoxybacillus vitaminiphilus]|uniref:Uncharacterized protein n=1 Tax=Paranoxybacillus vitaminiphilus TaxID=581036 RepID=A0A327Y0W3_9BACL|nr:hypothetical protein [Anoxybacillus vitaminiphilus]RAK14021.1 hypothetical protein B0I26_1394 [Anoxybacillus vitaminiphilus]